jgi:hypothetical protein
MAGHTFLALYRGRTVGEAKLVAVCSDPAVVAEFAARFLPHEAQEDDDPVLATLQESRRAALRLIVKEGRDAEEA